MLDGTYKIHMETPVGRKKGKLYLKTEGDKLMSCVEAPILGRQFFEWKPDGDTFTGDGEFELFLVGDIYFTVEGGVNGDEVQCTLDTNKGPFVIEGTRV